MPNIHKYHLSGLKHLCTETGTLERLKDSPVDDTDRTLIATAINVSPPIEMQNDERERHRYAQMASIQMAWTYGLTAAQEPKERDRLTMNGKDYRIRKVKRWPDITTPAFWEIHIEDET